MGSGGGDFVNDIFDGDDTVLSEGSLNDSVGGEGDSLLVDLSVTSLVDELTNSLQVGLSANIKRTLLETVRQEDLATKTYP